VFKIDSEWIKKNCTKRKGYTKEQLKILGIKWPPIKGWKTKIINKEISLKDKEMFELKN